MAQTIRYVKPAGGGDASSWSAASADLQAVINASGAGDQVWVAGGTYKPGGDANTDQTISFSMKNGVAIYGGFVGTENSLSERPASVTLSQPSTSILSGEINDATTIFDNIDHLVANTALNNTAILDGFIITAGQNSGAANGGGMLNRNSNPTLRNCQFTTNLSLSGGGMYNDTGSSPILINCTFANNRANIAGAIYNSPTSSLTLTNCTFSFNSSLGFAAIIGGTLTVTNCSFNNNNGATGSSDTNGGALAIGTGSTLTNCLFVSNNGQGRGGAVYIGGSPTITNCTFRGNLASGLGGAANGFGYGGALYIAGGSPVITNCSFSNNNAAARRFAAGGAIYCTGTPTFINCSFGNNQTSGPGGAIYCENGTPTLINCIIWGNMPNGVTNGTGGSAMLTFTNTQDGTPGTGNLNMDPLFVDAPGDNLRLRACSPAIDRGDNGANTSPTDLAGNPRQVRSIDMGAYEFQGTPSSLVAISQQPNSFYSIPEGGTLTASVSVTGSVTSYQWYKVGPSGAPVALTGVSSATTATLTLPNLTTADNGSYYVVVTGACNSVTSTIFTLLVNTGMYTVKTGSWNDAAIWSLNRVPVSNDPVRIKHQVSIPASYAAQARVVSYDPGQRLLFGSDSRLKLGQ